MSPHDLGAVDKTNYGQSLMHMIKGNLGTGILAMPISIKHCGLLTAALGLPILCLIATFCVHLLIRSSQHLENKMKWSNLDYAALAKGAFKAGPRWMRPWSNVMNKMVDGILIISQLGICCVYLVFIVENIRTILKPLPTDDTRLISERLVAEANDSHTFDNGAHNQNMSTVETPHKDNTMATTNNDTLISHSINMNMGHQHNSYEHPEGPEVVSKSYLFVALIPFVVGVSFIRTLRRLSLLSAIANCIQVFGISLIIFNLMQDMPKESPVQLTAPLAEAALGFGSAMFAFEGISVVLPVYTRMKRPQMMGGPLGIINVSYVILLLLYCSVGLLGYLRYGNDVKGSITLNLHPSVLNNTIRGAFATSIFLSYPLQFYVANEIIWSWARDTFFADLITSNPKKLYKLEYLCRALLVLFTFILAISVPMLNLLMDLVGSISGCALCITLPAIIHLAAFWEDVSGTSRVFMILIDVSLIIFSLMAGSSGSFFSLMAIFGSLKH